MNDQTKCSPHRIHWNDKWGVKYLVLWTTQNKKGFVDHYHAHECLTDAREQYGELLEHAYLAHICAIVESSDYDTHPKLKNETEEEH